MQAADDPLYCPCPSAFSNKKPNGDPRITARFRWSRNSEPHFSLGSTPRADLVIPTALGDLAQPKAEAWRADARILSGALFSMDVRSEPVGDAMRKGTTRPVRRAKTGWRWAARVGS